MPDTSNMPEWIQRALDPSTPMTEANETVRTISMDGMLFPTIRMINGKLTRLSKQQAYDMAVRMGDYMQFTSDEKADEYSKRLSAMIQRKRSILNQAR